MGSSDPEDDICPICGSDPRRCALKEEAGGVCPREELGDHNNEDARREHDAEADHVGGLSPLGEALVLALWPDLAGDTPLVNEMETANG